MYKAPVNLHTNHATETTSYILHTDSFYNIVADKTNRERAKLVTSKKLRFQGMNWRLFSDKNEKIGLIPSKASNLLNTTSPYYDYSEKYINGSHLSPTNKDYNNKNNRRLSKSLTKIIDYQFELNNSRVDLEELKNDLDLSISYQKEFKYFHQKDSKLYDGPDSILSNILKNKKNIHHSEEDIGVIKNKLTDILMPISEQQIKFDFKNSPQTQISNHNADIPTPRNDNKPPNLAAFEIKKESPLQPRSESKKSHIEELKDQASIMINVSKNEKVLHFIEDNEKMIEIDNSNNLNSPKIMDDNKDVTKFVKKARFLRKISKKINSDINKFPHELISHITEKENALNSEDNDKSSKSKAEAEEKLNKYYNNDLLEKLTTFAETTNSTEADDINLKKEDSFQFSKNQAKKVFPNPVPKKEKLFQINPLNANFIYSDLLGVHNLISEDSKNIGIGSNKVHIFKNNNLKESRLPFYAINKDVKIKEENPKIEQPHLNDTSLLGESSFKLKYPLTAGMEQILKKLKIPDNLEKLKYNSKRLVDPKKRNEEFGKLVLTEAYADYINLNKRKVKYVNQSMSPSMITEILGSKSHTPSLISRKELKSQERLYTNSPEPISNNLSMQMIDRNTRPKSVLKNLPDTSITPKMNNIYRKIYEPKIELNDIMEKYGTRLPNVIDNKMLKPKIDIYDHSKEVTNNNCNHKRRKVYDAWYVKPEDRSNHMQEFYKKLGDYPILQCDSCNRENKKNIPNTTFKIIKKVKEVQLDLNFN